MKILLAAMLGGEGEQVNAQDVKWGLSFERKATKLQTGEQLGESQGKLNVEKLERRERRTRAREVQFLEGKA